MVKWSLGSITGLVEARLQLALLPMLLVLQQHQVSQLLNLLYLRIVRPTRPNKHFIDAN